MCGFTFTVFLSLFQLLPTAPFRILELGGTTIAAGLFLGLLTYASALSAPFTGALADRFGRRRMLLVASLAIAGFSAAYALTNSWQLLVGLVFFHGLFWSGLLSASAAYMTGLIPAARRAEGIGYWGMATVLATAFAPALGLEIYKHGWVAVCASVGALNLVMAAIAWRLPESERPARAAGAPFFTRDFIEWPVLAVSMSLFLCSFGYGGVTSFVAMWTEKSGLSPGASSSRSSHSPSSACAPSSAGSRIAWARAASSSRCSASSPFPSPCSPSPRRKRSSPFRPCSSARASGTSTPSTSPTSRGTSIPRAEARPSAPSSRPSTRASERAPSPWAR